VMLHHRLMNRQTFGAVKDFCPKFLKIPRKFFCATFDYTFSPTKIIKTFFGVASKKVFMGFSANLGGHFLKSNNVWRHFYADFLGCLLRF